MILERRTTRYLWEATTDVLWRDEAVQARLHRHRYKGYSNGAKVIKQWQAAHDNKPAPVYVRHLKPKFSDAVLNFGPHVERPPEAKPRKYPSSTFPSFHGPKWSAYVDAYCESCVREFIPPFEKEIAVTIAMNGNRWECCHGSVRNNGWGVEMTFHPLRGPCPPSALYVLWSNITDWSELTYPRWNVAQCSAEHAKP